MKEYLLQDRFGKYAYKVSEGSFDFTDDKKKAFRFGDWHDDLVKKIKNTWNSKRGPFKKVNPGSFFESLELPIDKGDILKVGKFKNKSFEYDHSQFDGKGGVKAVDSNGKETSLLAVRLPESKANYIVDGKPISLNYISSWKNPNGVHVSFGQDDKTGYWFVFQPTSFEGGKNLSKPLKQNEIHAYGNSLKESKINSFKVYLKESINFKPGEYLIYNPDFIDGIKFHDPRYNTKVLFVGRYDNQNALVKSTNNISHMENLSTRDFDNTEKVPLKMLMNLKDYEKYKSNRK